MILVRPVRKEDAEKLAELANIPGMYNLPSDPGMLDEKINISNEAFLGRETRQDKCRYVFVAEEVSTGQILGTSMVAGRHGTQETPHFYFQVKSHKNYSESTKSGFIHTTLTLKTDTEGPTELGGLAVTEEARNRPDHVGRQVSFARFLYVAMHREKFRSRMIAELLPPFDREGHAPLWEAIGRKFTNMDYWEADALASKNKEFILSLFPKGKIYASLLSADARDAIGKIGKATEPVQKMLTRIGFKYNKQIDPFDGGPHFEAVTDKIVPIKNYRVLRISENLSGVSEVEGMICKKAQDSEFKATAIRGKLEGDRLKLLDSHYGTVSELKATLGLSESSEVHFIPFYEGRKTS
jgi:arginine N-succinyltransferase